MKKYIARVKMSNTVQVEFELPENCDSQSAIEMQAKIEAKDKWGNADNVECLEYEEVAC